MFLGDVECPKCGSKAKSVGMTITTSMYIPETYDEEGKRINTISNQTSTELTCLKCKHVYNYTPEKDDTPRPL